MRILRRISYWLSFRARNAELAEEIATHEAMRRADLEARGIAPAEAASVAARTMGPSTRMREDARSIWLAPALEGVMQDMSYALRSLRRQPTFTAAAVLALAAGIGVSSALFTAYNSLYLRSWDASGTGRMVSVFDMSCCNREGGQPNGFSRAQVQYFAEHSKLTTDFVMSRQGGGDGFDGVTAHWVGANYFGVLALRMHAGRGFAPSEDIAAAPAPVAVVSHDYWRSTMGGDTVLGKSLTIEGIPFTIVGVAPSGFMGSDMSRVDAWIPLAAAQLVRPGDEWVRNVLPVREHCCTSVAARLRPGVAMADAERELEKLRAQMPTHFRSPPRNEQSLSGAPPRVMLAPYTPVGSMPPKQQARGSDVFALIGAGVVLVLLLACTNVANLLLARALARQREIAMRYALGASRDRLVRQLLTESFVLAAASGTLGLALARALPEWILRILEPGGLALQFTADHRVIAFTIAIASVSVFGFGLAPALHATRPMNARAGRLPLRSLFLSTQVAFCMVLLVSAALFTRSVRAGRDANLGFDATDVTEIAFKISGERSVSPRARQLIASVRARVRDAGFQQLALVTSSPFAGSVQGFSVPSTGYADGADRYAVSPEYFDLLGVPLLAGRGFTTSDTPERGVIVSEQIAAHAGGPAQAIGRTFVINPNETRTIIGVAPNIRLRTLQGVRPAYWEPLSDDAAPMFLVRGAESARRVTSIVAAVDPAIRVRTRTYASYVESKLVLNRVAAAIATMLGGLALILATVGMFGVFSYWVQQRRHEIGVRMALGAHASQVVRLVLRASARAVGWGAAVGLIGALIASQILRASLQGVSSLDPLAFLVSLGVLSVAAALATAVPAHRAASVSPSEALRAD